MHAQYSAGKSLGLFLTNYRGSGIPAEIARQVDSEITIPCPGPVESLNAAVAASVLLYEASQQRLSKPAGNPQHSSKKSIRGTGLAR